MKKRSFGLACSLGGLALVASACGGPAGNGVAAKPASAILAAARSATEGAQSFHLVVKMHSGPDEGTIEFDTQMPSTAELNAGLANGQRYTLLQVGKTAYLKANGAYLDAHGEAERDHKLADRCIKIPITPDSAKSVGVYAEVSRRVANYLGGGSLTKGATSTVNGRSVVAVKGKDSATLYVATTGKPYPVKLETPAGSATFSGWGQSLPLKPFSSCLTVAQANAGA